MLSLVTTLSLALSLSDYARGASVPSSRQYDELAGESIGDDQVVRTPGKLRVTENSGICETTPGVYQASGYGDIAQDKSIWFWFFESRNNAETDPLVVWFNGGPGSSSMIGLFQELGPCRMNNDSMSVSPNPMSWNNNANVLFIDQPIGVGYSFGNTTVGTSQQAAKDVWTFLQVWFKDKRFAAYENNDFGIWTESYGGHYGPIFAEYFLEQDAKIFAGEIIATPLNLQVLGIGDGIVDPLTQYPGYMAYSASNPYHPLVDSATLFEANTSYYAPGGCESQIIACNDRTTGTDDVCSSAFSYCTERVLAPLAGPYDFYYVPSQNPDPYPADLSTYLTDEGLMEAIGANVSWSMTSDEVYWNFAQTGDEMRSSRVSLERVINKGIRTVLYDGDADYILNYKGVEAMVDSLETRVSDLYRMQDFTDFTVNGQPAGLYKTAGTFSYVRFYGAGHEVPAYGWTDVEKGAATLQMFEQVMSGQGLFST